MAMRVPTVNGPSVEERPLQGGFQRSSASPELLGGGARQLQQFGDAATNLGTELSRLDRQQREEQARIEKQQRAEVAQTRAKDADVQFTQALTELQFHPERGYMSRRGRAAADSYDETLKQIDALKRKTLQDVTDPAARELAGHAFEQRANVAVQTISRHAATETQKWKIQSSDSRAESSLLV